MAAVSGGRLAQLREQAPRLLKKYRLPLLIFLAGLILSRHGPREKSRRRRACR